jgi:hypothetical protein
MRKLAVMMAVIGVAGAVARPAGACFDGCFNIFLSFPAVSCAGDGFTRNGSSLINNTSSWRWFMCAIPSNSKTDFGRFASAVSVNVTPGTACFAVIGDAEGNSWSIPAPLTKNFGGFIEDDWGWNDLTGSGGRNLSVQCQVPPGGKGFQYFEQTIWEGTP